MSASFLSTDTSTLDSSTTSDPPIPHERSSPEAIIEVATLIIILVASFFANILAMTHILTSPKLKKHHHNLLIANLNVIDLGVVLLSMTFSVVTILDGGTLLSTNKTVCTINGFFATTLTIGNFITVMCIAVDRYLSIVWSTRFPPTRRRMYLTIVFIWVACISIGMPPAVELLTIYEYTSQTHHCSPKWDTCAYYIVWSTVIFIITIPVMFICYVCIIHHILKSDRLLRSFETVKRTTHRSKKSTGSRVRGNHRNDLNLRLNCFRYTFPTSGSKSSIKKNIHIDEKYKCNRDDVYGGKVNGGFKEEEFVHHGIVSDETFVGDIKSGPYVISGQISEQARLSKSLADGGRDVTHRRMSSPCQLEDDPVSSTNHTSTDTVMPDHARNKLSAKRRRLSREKRVALTGAMLILTTISCWTPYSAIHFCQFPLDVSHPVAVTTMWMAYLNSLLDPLVYVFMNRKEKTTQPISRILRTFCCLPRKAWRWLCGKGNGA